MNSRLLLTFTVMTVAEVTAALYWLPRVQEFGGVYSTTALTLSSVLFAGLVIEQIAAGWPHNTQSALLAVVLAVVETAIWTQWAFIARPDIPGSVGLGPAFGAFVVMLTLLHTIEGRLVTNRGLRWRYLLNGVVEAGTLSAGWILTGDGYTALAGVVLVVGFGVEHGYRLAALEGE